MKKNRIDVCFGQSSTPLERLLDVHPDDVSKNLFIISLRRAVDVCDGVLWNLARRVGVHGRTMENWAKGRLPPYDKMQEYYRLFLDIAKEGKR